MKEIYLKAIKRKGLKINWIADQIKVNRSVLSRWLHGHEDGRIGKNKIERLERLLEID